MSFPSSRSVALAAFLGFSISSFAADVSGGSGKAGELKGADRAPVQPPKNTPEAATKNLAKTKIPEGFTADIWASEPLLANPVAFCFDGKGRMFVSETHRYRTSVLDIRHYMFMLEDDLANRNQEDWIASIKKNFPKDWQQLGKESEIVRLVQDSNGDGKADQSAVYADGFNSLLDGIASGVLWYNNALYFTNIPALTKMTGANKAETREDLHRGYGIRFSYTGHDFHGLIAGPDGRIYFSIGDRAASVKTKEGTMIELPDEGGVFRCEPDGTKLELVMHGLRNPQELAFDDYGNLFTGDNDSDQGDRERWVMIANGADAGWRIGWQHHPLGKEHNPWLVEKMWEPRSDSKGQPYYVLSPLANVPDGPSGLAYYPGTGLPQEYAGSFFLCGFKGSTAKSQVNTFKNEPSGVAYKLTGLTPFFDHVQATDVAFGPDSRIYVSAWDEGWERSDQGRIYRLSNEAARTAQAAQIAEVQKLLGEGFSQRPSTELVKLLGHADQRIRLEAQWALAAKPDGLDQLANVAKSGSGLARLHGIWGTAHVLRVGGAKIPAAKADAAVKILAADLADKDAEVRAQAAHVFSDVRVPDANVLIKLLADPSPRPRYFAALALAKAGNTACASAVVTMLRENDGKDLYLQHAGVMALAAAKNTAEIAKAAKDSSKSLRVAALLTYRRMGSDLVAGFLNDSDPTLVAEAARAINDVPIAAAMPALAKKVTGDGAPIESKDEQYVIRALNANFRTGGAAGAGSLAQYAAKAQNAGLRAIALEMLGAWSTPPKRDYIVGIYRPLSARDKKDAATPLGLVAAQLLSDKSERVLTAACTALAANDVKAAGPQLLTLVKDGQAPAKARVAAFDALVSLNAPEVTAAATAAQADSLPALHTAAAKFLGKRDPVAAAKELGNSFPTASEDDKKDILDALGTLQGSGADEILSKLLDDLKAGKIPVSAQVELIEAAGKRTAPAVKEKLAAWQNAQAAADPLARFAWALAGGDALNGEKLFKEHAVAQCLRCHKVAGTGGDAGPDLSKVAAKKDRKYILESIVNPNAAIAEGFQNNMFTLKNGDIKAGIVKSETADTITIQLPAPGVPPETIKKSDIKSRENAPSGMPPGFGDLLSKRELRDLVEYVSKLK